MDDFISIQLKRLKSPRTEERIMGCDQLAAASGLPPLAINLLEEAALLDSEPQVRDAANRALHVHIHPGFDNSNAPLTPSTEGLTSITIPLGPAKANVPVDTPDDESIIDRLKRIPAHHWLPVFFIGIALFDWLFPAAWVQEVLERKYPSSIRWMVFFSYAGETQKDGWEWSGVRGYLLMPDSFKKAKVLIISTYHSPSSSSVNSSWDGLAFLLVISAYGYAYIKLVRHRNLKNHARD